MTDQQKATRENQGTPFDLSSCAAMMEEVMGQQGCDCSEMMSQMMGQGGCAEMMATCCGVQGETEEAAATEATQEA